MKNSYKKIFIIILMIIYIILCFSFNCFAHSGRTDSNGGHKDNQNKSGLGSYHYHCGGNPPHLHSNGVCPYSSSKSSKSSSSSSSTKSTSTSSSTTKSSSSATYTSKKSSTDTTDQVKDIKATRIEISTVVTEMEIGDTRFLYATITPNDTTDKSITWKSSDESIATVSSTGKVIAKKEGTVTITANTSNNLSDSIEIKVEEKKVETKQINNSNENNVSYNPTNNVNTSNNEETDIVAGILGIGLVGIGCYLGYEKYKESKK